MTRFRTRLSYANVTATLALIFAMTGGAYAAITLPKNSVRANQIASGAVRSPEVKNHSLLAKDFKEGQLPAGARGPAGPPGLTGPPGPQGEPGSVDTSNFYSKAESDSRFKLRCPAGTILHAGACFEQSPRDTLDDFFDASRTCAAEGRRLPTFSELLGLARVPGVAVGGSGPTFAHELSSTVFFDSGNELVYAFRNTTGSETRAIPPSSAALAFRCVAVAAN